MFNKCSKTGFWICLLVLLIILCTWRHIDDPALRASQAFSAKSVPTQPAITASGAPDRDHDGLSDADERQVGLNPALSDTDADGKPDGQEGLRADHDRDGIIDALESALDDSDLDGVPDEFDAENTNPDNDTDGDRYGNGLEKAEGTNPMDVRSKPSDRDQDGIPDNIDANQQPISFAISKHAAHLTLKGSFSDLRQIHALQDALDQKGMTLENGVIMQNQYLEGNDAIAVAQKLIPKFLLLYRNGTIRYQDGSFEIVGDVTSVSDKKLMEQFLSEHAGLVHYVNITRIVRPDPASSPADHQPAEAVAPTEHNSTH